jgi:hypothetical protein
VLGTAVQIPTSTTSARRSAALHSIRTTVSSSAPVYSSLCGAVVCISSQVQSLVSTTHSPSMTNPNNQEIEIGRFR